MLPDGRYSAWFRIPMQAEGMGIVMLSGGKVTGRDTVIAYIGSYVQDGDQFRASIATRRHSPGQPGMFGIDELDIELCGRSTLTTATCTGTVKQRPNVPFEVVLVRITE